MRGIGWLVALVVGLGMAVSARGAWYELDAEGYLLAPDGSRALGYSVNDRFELITDAVGPIRIPLGEMRMPPVPTGSVILHGQLNAAGEMGEERASSEFVIIDSRGVWHPIELAVVLEARDATGTGWSFEAQYATASGQPQVVGHGRLRFDADGRLVSQVDTRLTFPAMLFGNPEAQVVDLWFGDGLRGVSALSNTESRISSLGQDGVGAGTLVDYYVEADGRVYGEFDNTWRMLIGQVIPEPGTAMGLLGLAGLGLRRGRGRR